MRDLQHAVVSWCSLGTRTGYRLVDVFIWHPLATRQVSASCLAWRTMSGLDALLLR